MFALPAARYLLPVKHPSYLFWEAGGGQREAVLILKQALCQKIALPAPLPARRAEAVKSKPEIWPEAKAHGNSEKQKSRCSWLLQHQR